VNEIMNASGHERDLYLIFSFVNIAVIVALRSFDPLV